MSGERVIDPEARQPGRADVATRPREPGDEAFLRGLYASTREEELAAVPWTDEQRQAFLAHQFDARERHYRAEFPTAEDAIIEVAGQPAGRLDVARDHSQLLVVDLALLPAYRGQGIGTHLLGSLLEESTRTGVPVHIHVEHANRARGLYERLGFRVVNESPPYLLMQWTPLENDGEGVMDVDTLYR